MCAGVRVCAVCSSACVCVCVICCLHWATKVQLCLPRDTAREWGENYAKSVANERLKEATKDGSTNNRYICMCVGKCVCDCVLVCMCEEQLTLPNKQQHSKKAKKQNKTTQNQNKMWKNLNKHCTQSTTHETHTHTHTNARTHASVNKHLRVYAFCVWMAILLL